MLSSDQGTLPFSQSPCYFTLGVFLGMFTIWATPSNPCTLFARREGVVSSVRVIGSGMPRRERTATKSFELECVLGKAPRQVNVIIFVNIHAHTTVNVCVLFTQTHVINRVINANEGYAPK